MSVVSAVKSFLAQKFWRPVADESVYYNPFNTAVYSLAFAAAAAYIGKPLLEKLDIELNRKFFLSIAPYIFLGGAARSLKDANIVNTILLETPFIYLMLFGFTTAVLLGSLKIEEYSSLSYSKVFGSIGLISLIAVLSAYSYPNPLVFVETGLIFAPLAFLSIYGPRVLGSDLGAYSFGIPVSAHFFDASTSFVALSRGAAEKHVLANQFIDLMGPAGMFVMKALIVIPVVYIICTDMEGDERRYYLFLIAVLGFALGTRNIISAAVVG
ncbi:DUF63 family protein [Candidatus Nanohalococcus occultus]|uniref:DUF63 family protein n=1 Tax=Candidatus Nanohalococcus occultus TaxID=2978047 RepID=UPI0039DF63AD